MKQTNKKDSFGEGTNLVKKPKEIKDQVLLLFFGAMKIGYALRPAKDSLGLKVPRVYKIPCSCGIFCIAQTGRRSKIFEASAGKNQHWPNTATPLDI